ncbi:MAG: NUDIX hydrolase [Rhodospirillales bacterium]|nr:NUDIX hydrolase [Rhodospirillales bacterium]
MTEKAGRGPSVEVIPEGDNRTRLVCPDCGYIEYANPKVIVGAVCTWQSSILLCKRAIAPALGLWTIPAGFMELGETSSAGAAREVWEEAQARVIVKELLGIYEIPHISQVNIIYRATMIAPEFAPGVESEAVKLVTWQDIPWDELAFPSVRWSLERYRAGDGPGVYAATAPMPAHVSAR